MSQTKESASASAFTHKAIYVRRHEIASVLIILANLGGHFLVLPIFVQLLVNSCCCVYLGTIMSSKLKRQNDSTLAEDKNKGAERIGQKQALKFPVVASAFLFGFYLIYKYVSKTFVNNLLLAHFSLTTVISTSNLLQSSLPFSKELRKVIKHVKTHKFLKSYLQIEDFDISFASIICVLISAVPILFYCFTRYWALNNVFGILFSIMALRNIDLSSFKVGFLLLWLLFFYDIFWVYGTDVMVTVAKNLNLPIKLLFPFINPKAAQYVYSNIQIACPDYSDPNYVNDPNRIVNCSMLGLGDIVIPGIFIALCLKFDIDHNLSKKLKKVNEFKIPYFTTSFVGYIAGICLTFAAMYIFDHPQPALLFLVPTCTLSVLVLGLVRGELKEMQEYETVKNQKVETEKKDKKDQNLGEKNQDEKKPLTSQ